MGLFVMSEKELQRIKIIEDVNKQRISVVQAAKIAGISRRQMTLPSHKFDLQFLSNYGTVLRG